MPFDCISYHPQDEILAVLSAAQERIAKPENWCQNIYGDWQQTIGPLCAWGAIRAVVIETTGHSKSSQILAAEKYVDKAAVEMGFNCAGTLNDETDHKTTKAMFSRAIELRLVDMAKEAVHVS